MSLTQHQMLQKLMNKTHSSMGGALIGGALIGGALSTKGAKKKPPPTAQEKADTLNLRAFQSSQREAKKVRVKEALSRVAKSDPSEIARQYDNIKPGAGKQYLASLARLSAGQASAAQSRATTAQVKQSFRNKGYNGYDLRRLMLDYGEKKAAAKRGPKGQPGVSSAQAHSVVSNWVDSVPLTKNKDFRNRNPLTARVSTRGPNKPKGFMGTREEWLASMGQSEPVESKDAS